LKQNGEICKDFKDPSETSMGAINEMYFIETFTAKHLYNIKNAYMQICCEAEFHLQLYIHSFHISLFAVSMEMKNGKNRSP